MAVCDNMLGIGEYKKACSWIISTFKYACLINGLRVYLLDDANQSGIRVVMRWDPHDIMSWMN